jgi:hypothetical protein
MSNTIRNNLIIIAVTTLIVEGLIFYIVIVRHHHPLWEALAPISLLTIWPIWGLQYIWQNGWDYGFLYIPILDVVFLSIMAFSIIRNHKVIGGVCLFVFYFLGMGLVAATY